MLKFPRKWKTHVFFEYLIGNLKEVKVSIVKLMLIMINKYDNLLGYFT